MLSGASSLASSSSSEVESCALSKGRRGHAPGHVLALCLVSPGKGSVGVGSVQVLQQVSKRGKTEI